MFVELQMLCAREAAARAELDAGCRADLQKIACLTGAPLRRARAELEGYLLSPGSLVPKLASNPEREFAELLALRCASDVFANAGLRFRARFRNYAQALLVAEQSFIEAMTPIDPDRRRRTKAPRQIAVPRIEFDEDASMVPQSMPSLSDVDEWIDELAQHLHGALESTVSVALRKILDRGMRSVARTSAAIRLAGFTLPA